MSKISEDVLRKIKRCMDLSASSNENEAALAFKQMQALMDKHGVNSQHVAAFDVSEHSTKLDVIKNPPKWVINLHTVIGEAMDCESMLQAGWGGRCKADIIYIGIGSTPEIATYAFDVMYRKLKADRAEFIKTHLKRYKTSNKTKLADAYCEGWVSNVYSKVKNLNPNLEVKEKINAYKATSSERGFSDKVYEPKQRFKKNDDKVQTALGMGFVKSKDIDLFAATGHTEQKLIGKAS